MPARPIHSVASKALVVVTMERVEVKPERVQATRKEQISPLWRCFRAVHRDCFRTGEWCQGAWRSHRRERMHIMTLVVPEVRRLVRSLVERLRDGLWVFSSLSFSFETTFDEPTRCHV